MSTNRASQALLTRIANLVVSELGRADLFVAQATAQVGLSDAHLNLLQQVEQDRLTDAASVARLVELSRMVDCIQDRSGQITLPTQDPRYLSDVFPQVLDNVAFQNVSISQEDQRRYEQALGLLYAEYPLLKKAAYQEFCVLRVEVQKKAIVLLEMQQNLQRMTVAAERTVLESELAERQRLHTEQQQLLDALDLAHGFRAAELIIATATRTVDQVPATVRTIIETIELLAIQDPITHDMHIACSFLPDHLAEDHWAPLRLTQAEIMQTLPPVAGAADPNALDEATIASIEVEVQTAVCERPWFWSALFENPHWDWRAPSAPISTGESTGAEELIPAYIYGLIFARNVKVKGQPSAQAHFQAVNLNPGGIADLLLHTLRPIDLQPIEIRPVGGGPGVILPEPINPGVLQPITPLPVIQPERPLRPRGLGPTLFAEDHLDLVLNPHVEPLLLLKQKQLMLQVLRLSMAVSGQVVDEEGNGLYQVQITLLQPTGPRQLLTDQEGRFTVTLSQGEYQLQLEKEGFVPMQQMVAVPATTTAAPIVMQQEHACPLHIRLLERVDGVDRPFTGEAKLVIRGDHSVRVEVMLGQSERQFKLPAGTFTVTVTSAEATEIALASQSVSLAPGDTTVALLTYTIFPAPVLSNPALQLIGFICRKVPRCP